MYDLAVITLALVALALAVACLYLHADRERLASHRAALVKRNDAQLVALRQCRDIALGLRAGRHTAAHAAHQITEVTTRL